MSAPEPRKPSERAAQMASGDRCAACARLGKKGAKEGIQKFKEIAVDDCENRVYNNSVP
jgi:hypothetical protein